ncbi:HAD-IA family hydrolase [Ideonella sp.]|uniref:HAD-IA family hydrolase n=1 Tax=Ideonella sp. TaxID=1929293 RepID=UPI003BB4FCA5
MTATVRAILFDLDGTLVDSAPDLAGAANALRSVRGLPALPYAVLRPLVGTGARGMVGAAMGVGPSDSRFETLRDEFLALYAERLLSETALFPQMADLLEVLKQRRVVWGIVTNKAARFAEPLVKGLGLDLQAAVLICGDTTPFAKPHPEPLLEAARRLACPVEHCVYVGDDLRDIDAGRAAGMRTMAAGWGYLGDGPAIDEWKADWTINSPAELLNCLKLA